MDSENVKNAEVTRVSGDTGEMLAQLDKISNQLVEDIYTLLQRIQAVRKPQDSKLSSQTDDEPTPLKSPLVTELSVLFKRLNNIDREVSQALDELAL